MVRPAALVATVLLLAGCASQTDNGPTASPSPMPSGGVVLREDGGLVLQVAYTGGGFRTPRVAAAQLPLVSVYANGRVLTEAAVIAVHPGPALPQLQVTEVDPGRVEELAQRAVEVGVGRGVDYGQPPVADVPATRVTVVTAAGEQTSEAAALQRGLFPEGERIPGLTEDQAAAREELQAFVDELTGLTGDSDELYEPEAVAALVDQEFGPGANPDDVATWPGPALPGDPMTTGGPSCSLAEGEAVTAVLEAAAGATTDTVWANPDGGRWAVSLRPLLPHEDHCADLPPA